MDFSSLPPEVQNLILGVTSNALTAVLACSGKKAWGAREKRIDVEAVIASSIRAVADQITWRGPGKTEEVALFLGSPEIEEQLRRLYSTLVMSTTGNEATTELESQFLSAFGTYVDLTRPGARQAGARLFQIAVAGCNQVLTKNATAGDPAAHEYLANLRHRIVLDAIEAARHHSTAKLPSTPRTLAAVKEFEAKYRQQVAARHKYLVPPHLDAARKIPIGALFVEPRFHNTAIGNGTDAISWPDFLELVS